MNGRLSNVPLNDSYDHDPLPNNDTKLRIILEDRVDCTDIFFWDDYASYQDYFSNQADRSKVQIVYHQPSNSTQNSSTVGYWSDGQVRLANLLNKYFNSDGTINPNAGWVWWETSVGYSIHEILHGFELPHSFSSCNTCEDLPCDLECANSQGLCETSDCEGPTNTCTSNGNNIMGYGYTNRALTPCQWETFMGTALCYSYPWFYTDEVNIECEALVIDHINNPNEWSQTTIWNEAFTSCGDIIIKTGSELIVDGTILTMWKGTKIIVERGARLILTNQAEISAPFGRKFEGIFVYGNSLAPHVIDAESIVMSDLPSNHAGVFRVDFFSRVRRAKVGANDGHPLGTFASPFNNGAYFSFNRAVFQDCDDAIKLNYYVLKNESKFSYVIIEGDSANPNSTGISVNNNSSDFLSFSDINISNCGAYAMLISDSDIVIPNGFTIRNCTRGMVANSSIWGKSKLKIGESNPSTFNIGQNSIVFELNGVEESVFDGIRIDKNFIGIYARGQNDFDVINSEFKNSGRTGQVVLGTLQNVLVNTGEGNNIYSCNQFSNEAASGDRYDGIYSFGNNAGFRFITNDFEALTTDTDKAAYIAGNSEIGPVQSSEIDLNNLAFVVPVGNTFNTDTEDFRTVANSVQFDYIIPVEQNVNEIEPYLLDSQGNYLLRSSEEEFGECDTDDGGNGGNGIVGEDECTKEFLIQTTADLAQLRATRPAPDGLAIRIRQVEVNIINIIHCIAKDHILNDEIPELISIFEDVLDPTYWPILIQYLIYTGALDEAEEQISVLTENEPIIDDFVYIQNVAIQKDRYERNWQDGRSAYRPNV